MKEVPAKGPSPFQSWSELIEKTMNGNSASPADTRVKEVDHEAIADSVDRDHRRR